MNPINERPTERDDDFVRLFRALCDTTRLRVLAALMNDEARRVDELETMEVGTDGPSHKTVWVELHHSHIPHLDETGLVDWDRERGTVTRGEDFEEIRPFLELLGEHLEDRPDRP